VKTMPEDGFDWGTAWGVDSRLGISFFKNRERTGKPEAMTRFVRTEEYMLAAQAAFMSVG